MSVFGTQGKSLLLVSCLLLLCWLGRTYGQVTEYRTWVLEDGNNGSVANHTNNNESELYKYPIWIPWVICASVFVVIVLVSTISVCIFQHKREKSLITVVTTVLGLSVVMFCLFVIPVDIFNVSHTYDPTQNSMALKILYYSSYLLLLMFGTCFLPFAYFWYEEGPEMGENDDDDKYALTAEEKAKRTSYGMRLFHTLKYTIFTIIAGVLIVIIGLVLSAFGGDAHEDSTTDWLDQIVDVQHYGDRAIRFIVGVLAVIGCLGFNIYTAYGLSALPIGLMKRKQVTYKNQQEVNSRLGEIDDEIGLLQKKYSMKGTPMDKKDKKTYDKLVDERRESATTSMRIERSKKSIIAKLEPCTYPFRLALGFLLLVIVLFLMISLIINMIFRTVKSQCGILCGFVTEENCNFNPLDLLLTYSSIIFPIDYILFAGIIILFLLCSMVSLSSIGLRFLCIKLYKLKTRATVPQGLLTSCIFLMFIILVTSFMLPSFAPIYTTFGSQKYQDPVTGQWKECALSAFNTTRNTNGTHLLGIYPEEIFTIDTNTTNNNSTNGTRPCFMTELSQNVNSVAIGVPIFSIIFYFENWLFVLCWIIGFFVAIFRKPASFEEEDTYNEDEEIMKRPLRGRSYKSYASGSSSSLSTGTNPSAYGRIQ